MSSEPKFYGYETPVPDERSFYERLRQERDEWFIEEMKRIRLEDATPIEPHVEDGVEVYTITDMEG